MMSFSLSSSNTSSTSMKSLKDETCHVRSAGLSLQEEKTRRRRKSCLCWGTEPHFKGLLEYGVPNPIQSIIMASSWLNTWVGWIGWEISCGSSLTVKWAYDVNLLSCHHHTIKKLELEVIKTFTSLNVLKCPYVRNVEDNNLSALSHKGQRL